MIALTATAAMLTYRFVMNAYILIGGRSHRMGVSKTELFLERIIAAASPVFEEIVAVQRFGGETAVIRTIFEEPHEHDGAIFGVARALRDVQDRGLTHGFVLAVDYPMITADVLRYLRDRGGVPIWDGRPQMLCAVWDVRTLPRIEERIARGQFDLHGLVDREMIPESELRAHFHGEPLRNVNTPEEWEAVRSHG
jgi:molybdopterin-guanine dinucleotide biosynthesis protein A